MLKLLKTLASITVLAIAATVLASPPVTLEEFEALFPDYVNHEEQVGFQAPCVDANGKLLIHVNVADILGQVNEPIAVAMLCQQVGLPAFTPGGPVTFSNGNVQLLSLNSVPGHPDAFSIEMIIPVGAEIFDICIENTGWPEGCLEDILDLAAWDLASVGTGSVSMGRIKANF